MKSIGTLLATFVALTFTLLVIAVVYPGAFVFVEQTAALLPLRPAW
ncbi:MAG: hypothetical protein V4693_04615 [Pseudomonadota bacterium]